MAATKTSLTRTENDLATRTDNEGLPTLFGRLGDDIMQLFNSQLALFKVEIKEEANAYARAVTLIAQANFSQPASYALGFVVTGGFYVLVGAVVVMLMKNRLAEQNLVPQRTVAELRKDKQWLKNEL